MCGSKININNRALLFKMMNYKVCGTRMRYNWHWFSQFFLCIFWCFSFSLTENSACLHLINLISDFTVNCRKREQIRRITYYWGHGETDPRSVSKGQHVSFSNTRGQYCSTERSPWEPANLPAAHSPKRNSSLARFALITSTTKISIQ